MDRELLQFCSAAAPTRWEQTLRRGKTSSIPTLGMRSTTATRPAQLALRVVRAPSCPASGDGVGLLLSAPLVLASAPRFGPTVYVGKIRVHVREM